MRAVYVPLVSIVVLASVVHASALLHTQGPSVYTVRELQHLLRTQPTGYLGHALLVRGKVVPCMTITCRRQRLCHVVARIEMTYRVEVRPIAHSICGVSVCYEAVLLDAAQ